MILHIVNEVNVAQVLKRSLVGQVSSLPVPECNLGGFFLLQGHFAIAWDADGIGVIFAVGDIRLAVDVKFVQDGGVYALSLASSFKRAIKASQTKACIAALIV